MKSWFKKALLVLVACAALGTIGPIQRVIAQGMVNLTTFVGTEQITGIGYPCITSCYVTTKQLAQYAAGQTAGINAQTGTSYTVVAADAGKVVTFSNGSPVAVTLPVATTTGFASGTQFEFTNVGAGAVTITPTTSTINGAATYVLNQNRSALVVSDGTNYQVSPGGGSFQGTPAAITEGGTGSATAAAARTALAVAGTGTTNTFTLAQTFTAAQVPTGGVGAAGGFTISPRLVGTCGSNGGSIAATSAFTNQTPVATEVYIAEVFVPANMTVTGVAVLNGTVVSGNVKVGLANSSGVNVATSASTATAGTSVYQLVPFTGTYAAVGPATYYVTTFYDNNTQRATAWTQGSCGAAKQTGQTYATGFTTITPPTTFTTALGPVANLY